MRLIRVIFVILDRIIYGIAKLLGCGSLFRPKPAVVISQPIARKRPGIIRRAAHYLKLTAYTAMALLVVMIAIATINGRSTPSVSYIPPPAIRSSGQVPPVERIAPAVHSAPIDAKPTKAKDSLLGRGAKWIGDKWDARDDVKVKGYTRKDGTRVEGYSREKPRK